jgi:uncharacterized membrane protein required for colicin V production
MNWLLDIALVSLFLIIVIIDAKRGFVKAVWGFARAIASSVLAVMFGGALGTLLYKVFILDAVTDTVYATVVPMIDLSNGAYNVAGLFERMPDGFADLLSRFGVTPESIEGLFGSITHATESNVREMAQRIAEPIADVISTVLGYVIIFLIAMIALFIVGKVVDLLSKLPVINTLNSFLGAVFGAASGFIYLLVICLLIGVFVEYGLAGESTEALSSIAQDSYIFRFFCRFSPVDFININ